MEDILDEIVPADELKKFEQLYNNEVRSKTLSTDTEFQYAWCLVRSRYEADIKKGIVILENLFQTQRDEKRRDYLYYLAIGNARLKQYSKALQHVRDFLLCEPGNQQVIALETIIKKRRENEAYQGMFITGAVAAVAVAGLAFILKKSSR